MLRLMRIFFHSILRPQTECSQTMPRLAVTGQVVEINRIGAEELFVEWRIPNFSSLLPGRSDFYDSPVFRTGEERFYLRLLPNCERESWNPASGWMRLELVRCDFRQPQTFRFSVGIRGSRGVEKSRGGEQKFSGYDQCAWSDFCQMSELMEHKTRLMPDDMLNIVCVLKRTDVAAGVLTHPPSSSPVAPTNRGQFYNKRDAWSQTDCNLLETEVLAEGKLSSQKRGYEKLSDDIARLLASGEDSDVTVQVGNVEFKAHKLIISARCPVLAAMFRQETDEGASNKISICDSGPDVFKQYLHFIYTGSVERLSEQNVFNLYHVADKYLADDLKQQCLEHIRNTLSVQTFCETVELALTHGESDLLQHAHDFATRNIPTIIRSVGWQNFIRRYPTEANEILIKCIRA